VEEGITLPSRDAFLTINMKFNKKRRDIKDKPYIPQRHLNLLNTNSVRNNNASVLDLRKNTNDLSQRKLNGNLSTKSL
jgi:hypothetical protein